MKKTLTTNKDTNVVKTLISLQLLSNLSRGLRWFPCNSSGENSMCVSYDLKRRKLDPGHFSFSFTERHVLPPQDSCSLLSSAQCL